MRIERARGDDIPEVEHLLASSGLPLDGVGTAFQTGVVARDGRGIGGAAAVEPYGTAGLLRSVVVTPELRGTGVGRALLDASERLALELGVEDLYLLTETAESWFARRGYQPIERDSVPDPVRASIEFTTACATTAVTMRRRLGGEQEPSAGARVPTGSNRTLVVERRDPREGDDHDQHEANRGSGHDRERRGEA